MCQGPPRCTRTVTLFPYTTLFRFRRCEPVPSCRARNSNGKAGDGANADQATDLPVEHVQLAPGVARRNLQLHRSRLAILMLGHADGAQAIATPLDEARSEEHTSELQSLMRNSYAVFCLKKKTKNKNNITYLKQQETQR